MWGNEKEGFILTYRLGENQTWSFQGSSEENTALEIMGANQETQSISKNNYTVSLINKNEQDMTLGIKIDELSRESESANGNESIDFSPVTGKDFEIVMNALGKETEFHGIDELKVDMGRQNGGVQSIINSYRNLFMDLPGKPVKFGDSWISNDQYTGPFGNMELTVTTETENTLEGFETINDKECLKVNSTSNSKIEGSGEQDGNTFDFTADSPTEITWYFAYKLGTLVKVSAKSDLTGTIKLTGSYDFSIPITQKTTATLELVQ